MKYLDEFRDAAIVQRQAALLHRITTRPWTIMEICGGQTHAILRFGIDEILPPSMTLIHGPGCPVCVTPASLIDQAAFLSNLPGVVLCTYGDMLRVPGGKDDLQSAKARGGDVRMVYSPLDAVELAQWEPDCEVVFFAVGFETTIPGTALAILRAKHRGLRNFSVLSAHVRVLPALQVILQEPACRVQGLLAAGHVCTVTGCGEYEPLAREFKIPVAVTGFEPVDILDGIIECVRQLEQGTAQVVNRYARSVRAAGNPVAQALVHEVFEPVDMEWRGLPEIPEGGFKLRNTFQEFDAAAKFAIPGMTLAKVSECIAGAILQGIKKPGECPAFGHPCTPLNPLGAPMVSSEGACAAYYRYRPQLVEIATQEHRRGE